MAESQSRYGIIEDLTSRLGEARANIASTKSAIEKEKAEFAKLETSFEIQRKHELEDFENLWKDKRDKAKKLEEEYGEAKVLLDRKLTRDKDTFGHNFVNRENDLKTHERIYAENIKASEEKIKEIKEAIEALKQVSKESAARNPEKVAAKK